MLPFWKKTLQKNKSPLSSPGRQLNGTVESAADSNFFANYEPCSRGPLSNFRYDKQDAFAEKSRLSLTFQDALKDKVALTYFTQYLEARSYISLLNALLDLEQLLKGSTCCSADDRTLRSESICRKNFVVRARSNDVGGCEKSNKTPIQPPPRVRCVSESGDRSPNVSGTRIWQRYLAEDAPEHIRVPEELRIGVQVSLNQSEIQDHAFHRLHGHVYQTLEKDLWNDFVWSEWHVKYQVEILTGRTVTLADILHHNAALSSFIEFLEQEGCQHIVEFWLAATNFESHFSQNDDSDPSQAQNDAMIIYDKYLSLQATSPLGVDNAVRCEIEQGICVELSTPRPDCFQPALRIALGYLQSTWLRPFLSSQYYVHLLSDLMRSSRATTSPASSVTDISVESSTKHDPDSIWKRRRQHSGLSIGRIDQLGRFETDMEPGPDRKSESRITRVVKKLVSKDEGKAQEEMAWRVAEMIVKDVTDVTMGGGVGHSDEDNEEDAT